MPKKFTNLVIILILQVIVSTMVFAAASDDQSLLDLEELDTPQKPVAFEKTQQNFQPKVRITSLGILPKGYQIIPDSIKMSPDLQTVAYAAYSDNTHNIIHVNDQTSPVYYAVQPGSPIISPELNRHAYIAHTGINKSVIVVDGKVIDKVFGANNFIFSPDGSRYAVKAQKKDQQYVIIDGKPGPPYPGIPIKDNFTFSPDSKRFIYVVFKNNTCFAIVDGQEEPMTFNFIQNVKFSPDSTQYAYKARTEKKANGQEKWCVVKDGRAGYAYDKIFDLMFSYDSKHLAYSAIKGKKMVLVLDGQEGDTNDLVGMPLFSFDSKTFAYAYAKNNQWYIVVDDQKSSAFDGIFKFYFSPDSKRNAFFAKKGDEWFCVVDGNKSTGFEKMVEAFKFSWDSSHYAYAGVDESGSRMISNGDPGKIYRSVGEPYYSPDSRHLVYKAVPAKEDGWITILDGVESKKIYNGIAKYEFSPDSKHLAFPAFINLDQTIMVVDGVQECADTLFKILGDPTFSPDGNHLVYHGMREPEKWHLIINGQILPETYGGFMKGTPIIFDSPTHFYTLGVKSGGEEFVVIDVEIPESLKLRSGINQL